MLSLSNPAEGIMQLLPSPSIFGERTKLVTPCERSSFSREQRGHWGLLTLNMLGCKGSIATCVISFTSSQGTGNIWCTALLNLKIFCSKCSLKKRMFIELTNKRPILFLHKSGGHSSWVKWNPGHCTAEFCITRNFPFLNHPRWVETKLH